MDFRSHEEKLREEINWKAGENASAPNSADPGDEVLFADQLLAIARQAKTQRIPSQFQSPYEAAVANMLEFMVQAPKKILSARVFIASAEVKLSWLKTHARSPMYDINELQQEIAAKQEEITATESVIEGYRELLGNIHEWEGKRHGNK